MKFLFDKCGQKFSLLFQSPHNLSDQLCLVVANGNGIDYVGLFLGLTRYRKNLICLSDISLPSCRKTWVYRRAGWSVSFGFCVYSSLSETETTTDQNYNLVTSVAEVNKVERA